MNRYSHKRPATNHDLATVYSRYNAKHEPDFVEKFFRKEELTAIIEECGIPLPAEMRPKPEHTVTLGKSSLRADLVIEDEGTAYYFEVMSQLGGGRWDDDHHRQLYLKSTRMRQMYDEVHTFAVAFKEFDPCYLEEIQEMDDWYAIVLTFSDEGYKVNVYGSEEKRRKKGQRSSEREELARRWREQLVARGGYPTIVTGHSDQAAWNTVVKWRLPNDSTSTELSIPFAARKCYFEWAIQSRDNKISVILVTPQGAFSLDPEEVLRKTQESLEFDLEGARISHKKNTRLHFKFDLQDFSAENVERLDQVTRAFARAVGQEDLLNP